jgi:hypothetical protein
VAEQGVFVAKALLADEGLAVAGFISTRGGGGGRGEGGLGAATTIAGRGEGGE